MTKPLWEATVIEGLDNVEGVPPGGFAIMQKIHHAAVDGVTVLEITSAVHDLEPDAPTTVPDSEWKPERPPSPGHAAHPGDGHQLHAARTLRPGNGSHHAGHRRCRSGCAAANSRRRRRPRPQRGSTPR